MPWFKFHAADWMSDPSLRMCSLAARGAWIDLLAIMHGSNANRGYLRLPNGAPMQPVHIARIVGCTTDEADAIVRELEEAAVFSRTDDGCIYSRRMVRDEAEYQTFAAYGAKGGNPSVVKGKKGGLTPPLTPLANPPLKAPLNPDSDKDSDSDSDGDEDKDQELKGARAQQTLTNNNGATDAQQMLRGRATGTASKSKTKKPQHVKLTEEGALAVPVPMTWPPELRAAWVSFIEMRYSINAPVTTNAVGLLVAEVEKYPAEKRVDVVNQSTRNSWRDFFPLKEQSNGRKSSDVRGSRRHEVVGDQDERIDIPIFRATAQGGVSRQTP